jgi:ribosomal subunit interface protein
MEIKIQSRNLEITPRAENYIQKKFDRLERHLSQISDAKIEVSRSSGKSQGKSVVAQMTLSTGKYTLRGQDTGVNLFAAVDAVTDVVDRQIRRLKGKVYRSGQSRKAARSAGQPETAALDENDLDDQERDEAEEELGQLVRTKRFSMTPMSIEDAILQMELLDHSFFLFFNTDTEQYAVAYRRNDGGYGVIEPETA